MRPMSLRSYLQKRLLEVDGKQLYVASSKLLMDQPRAVPQGRGSARRNLIFQRINSTPLATILRQSGCSGRQMAIRLRWYVLASNSLIHLYEPLQGETQHKKVKIFYKRASKAKATRSITKHERRERVLRNIAECSQAAEINMNAAQNQVSSQQKKNRKGAMLGLEDHEKLPYTDPNDHYHIGKSTKFKLNIYEWPGKELEQDFVYKVRLMLFSCILMNAETGLVSQSTGSSLGSSEWL